ncbi:MAG TPA: DUF4169 family protein [Aestuariivirgaceae bacterium]|nr:DUF4169 family protein [Aestuariivirgaceae bacterium]
MAEIVNLRLARKRKDRGERERTAGENRARFGRSRAEVAREAAERALEETRLSAHRRDDGDER